MRISHFIAALGLMAACSQAFADSDNTVKVPANGYPDFAMGIDASWTTRIESDGTITYYTGSDKTTTTTVPEMVYDYRMDAVRLRVWVNPSNSVAKAGFSFKVDNTTYTVTGTNGNCSSTEMLALAKRFAANGQRLMVAFHLSDTWADPARQFIPSDWSSCTTASALAEKAADHITEVLTLLKEANINVAWVQIGNETNTGMLKYQLPSSSTTTTSPSVQSYGCNISSSETPNNFVTVWAACAEAAKAIYPDAQTVLHLAKASQSTDLTWTLSKLQKAGLFSKTVTVNGSSVKACDMIGLSLYPGLEEGTQDYTAQWKTSTANAITNIGTIYSTYGLPTILCEIGMNNEWSESVSSTTQSDNITQCNTDVAAFTSYLIEQLGTPSTSHCYGFFYWEAEQDYTYDTYKMGACVDADASANGWKRTNLIANSFWSTCQSNSSFPDGGLVDASSDDDDATDTSSKTLLLYSSSWTSPYALCYNSTETTPSGNGTAMTEVSDGYYKVTTSDGDNKIKFSDNGSNSVTVSVPSGDTFLYNVDNSAWESEAYQAYDTDGNETTSSSSEAYGLYYDYNLDYNYGTITGLKNTAANNALDLVLPSTTAAEAYNMTGIGPRAFDKNGWRDSNRAFDGNLASVTIPSSITYIDYEAFVYNQSMTAVNFSEGLVSIGTAAFEGCKSLTSLTFPSTLTTFYNTSDWVGNFAWSDALTTVDLSKCSKMTDLAVNTFAECNYLQYVYLPVTLDEIGSSVFTRSYPADNSPDVELYYRITPAKTLTTFASCLADYYPDFSSVSGLTAYYAESKNDAGTAIVMQPWTTLAAQGEGLVLKATAGETYDIPLSTTTASSISGNMMTGNTSNDTFTVSNGMYFLSDGQFLQAATDGTLAKGKAYLNLGSSSSAKSLAISFADPTGISAASVTSDAADVWYNLAGQRVNHPQHGLYIHNGEKMVVR